MSLAPITIHQYTDSENQTHYNRTETPSVA